MTNLNKPKQSLFVDLVNQTSRRITPIWANFNDEDIVIGTPQAVERSAETYYRNSKVDVFDPIDTERQVPYTLYYDRIYLKDLGWRYLDDNTVYLTDDPPSVNREWFVNYINEAVPAQMEPSDLMPVDVAISTLPTTVDLQASDSSLLYCGQQRFTITIEPPEITEAALIDGSPLMLQNAGFSLRQFNGVGLPEFPESAVFPRAISPDRRIINNGFDLFVEETESSIESIAYSAKAQLLTTVPVEPESILMLDLTVEQPGCVSNAEDYIESLVQIDDELCIITAVEFDEDSGKVSSLTVRRGVDDTVPKQHEAGQTVWIYYKQPERENNRPGNDLPYAVSSALGEEYYFRFLSRVGAVVFPDVQAQSEVFTTTGRLSKPYPARRVRVNGRWDNQIVGANRDYTVTWQLFNRYDDGIREDRRTNLLGWFEHEYFNHVIESHEQNNQFKITVHSADGAIDLYDSDWLPTPTSYTVLNELSHTFTMPAFEGDVILKIETRRNNLYAQFSELQFPVVEATSIPPKLGGVKLKESSNESVFIEASIDVLTTGFPTATIVTDGRGLSHPYSIAWEVDLGSGFTPLTEDSRYLYIDPEELESYDHVRYRVIVTITNGDQTDTLTSEPYVYK